MPKDGHTLEQLAIRGHSHRGLGRALIAQAFAPLVERGEAIVVAEADTTDVASNALLTGLGGNVVGGTVELRRPARSVQGPTHR